MDDLEFDYVSVHALKLSVGSADAPRKDYLQLLTEIAHENGARSISDHLGFTRDGDDGVEMGHFAPLPWTQQALDATARNIDFIQNYVDPLHLYLENIAYLFRWNATMSESDFLSQVLRLTGCGWLLDVTNVYANSLNFGFASFQFVRQVMPAAERVQRHLAGGFFDVKVNMYIDSHSHPIPDAVWDLYRYSLEIGWGKVDAIFIERDQNFPAELDWRREVQQARSIATQVASSASPSSR